MRRDKSAIENDRQNESSIVEGWVSVISKEYRAGELNDHEKAKFNRARFSDEHADKSSFVLGGQINWRF
jgi:hypothetical protein